MANLGVYKGSRVKEEAAWGVILCGVIRHVSDGLSKLNGTSKERIMDEIIQNLLRERERETGGTKGGEFVNKGDNVSRQAWPMADTNSPGQRSPRSDCWAQGRGRAGA